MKQNRFFLNIALAAVVGIAVFVCVLIRTFAPAVILPRMDIPNMVLLSLLALLLEYYLAGKTKRNILWNFLLSAICFGLFPYAAGFAGLLEAAKLALVGGVVFSLTAWLFDSARERISTGPVAKAAPALTAFGLYLSAQCFSGIFL